MGLGKDKYKKQNYEDRHKRILEGLATDLGFESLSLENRAKLALLTFQTMAKFKRGKYLKEVKDHW